MATNKYKKASSVHEYNTMNKRERWQKIGIVLRKTCIEVIACRETLNQCCINMPNSTCLKKHKQPQANYIIFR